MSLVEKKRFLTDLSEDEFRDTCVRPLFELSGLRFQRDTCGINEEGKDCIFLETDKLGQDILVAVQTKRGQLNMAGTNPIDSVNTAFNQLDMALKARVKLDHPPRIATPGKVILCASGLVNDNARTYIHDHISDSRMSILDADWLIPKIDELMPWFWARINKTLFPYLQALRTHLLSLSDTILIRTKDDKAAAAPFTDEAYAPLYLVRITGKPVTRTVSRPLKQSSHKHVVPHTEYDIEPKVEEYEAADILKSHQQLILVLGEGGSGKTTALRRIAYKLIELALTLESESVIPVLLSATTICGAGSLLDLMAATCKSIANTDSTPFDDTDLTAGRALLLIDGLEEVGPDSSVEAVLTKLVEFRTQFPKSKIVVATRDYGFIRRMPAFGAFAHFRITELSLANAAKIVNRSLAGQGTTTLIQQEVIRRLQDVHGLTLTPMLVTVFVATADFKTKDIPPNITEIFSKYTELMLGRWDSSKGLAQQYEAGFKDLLLRSIALRMHDARLTAVPLADFEAVVREEIARRPIEADPGIVLTELLDRSNLLIVDDGSVSFRHPLLREFFAGRALKSVDELSSRVADDWWRRALIFYFGDHPDRHSEIMKLAKFSEDLPLPDLYDAAVTIGLSAQACYYAETNERLASLAWVITAMSMSHQEFIKEVQDSATYPLASFIHCYMLGRDAVASSLAVALAATLIPEHRPKVHPEALTALEQFWCIVGMLEAGDVEAAFLAAKSFNPEDPNLLLALDIGCFYVTEMKISSTDDKYWAGQIRGFLAPKIQHLRYLVMKEFKTHLLEMRNGRVVAVDAPEEFAEADLEASKLSP